MSDKLLFLTGRLAEPRLSVTVAGLGLPPGSWRIQNIGIKVAALMTEAIVRNRLKPPLHADRVIVPGRSRMDLGSFGSHFGVPFERGPDELADLPQYFGRGRPPHGPFEVRHPHLRRDRRRAHLLDCGTGQAWPRAQGRRRRRHRHRLPARRQVPAP